MQRKFIICYVTDNNDLYSHECSTREEVDDWLSENQEYKAIVVEAQGDGSNFAVSVDYHT